jgi:hypothetical protein
MEIHPVKADNGTCGQMDIRKLTGSFHDYGKALKKGHLHIGWADFIHFQRRVKLTSLTLDFAVFPLSYSEDIIVDFGWYTRTLRTIPFKFTTIRNTCLKLMSLIFTKKSSAFL